MKQSRLEWKVGLFALVALILLMVMILQFSKGLTLFESTYILKLRTSNVGGIKAHAGVLKAGVQIGSVLSADLDPDGRTVIIRVKILSRYQIRSDALFLIEQAGFLGDQYVAVVAGSNEADRLKDGDEVACLEPFNLQEAARSAVGLMQRLDQTTETLNQVVRRVDQLLLSEQTLTNLTVTIANLRQLSQQGISVMDELNGLIQTNRPGVAHSVTNLALFSEQLNGMAEDLRGVIATNRAELAAAIRNFEKVGRQVNALLDDLQAGKGLAGGVLQDEPLRLQFANAVSQLSILTSNMNKYGLLYKPKVSKTSSGSTGSMGRSSRR